MILPPLVFPVKNLQQPLAPNSKGRLLGSYSQYFISFVYQKWALLARVFVPDKPFQSIVMLHCTLLGPFVSYKENEVL